MKVASVKVIQISIPMREPMIAAHGTFNERKTILVRIDTDIGVGWGECPALPEPTYASDWSDGEYRILCDFLCPALIGADDVSAESVPVLLSQYKLHHPAKSALEMAVLDAQLRAESTPLASYLGSQIDYVEPVIVIGLLERADLMRSVEQRTAEGYRHFKLKIAPGRDLDRIDPIQKHFPDITLQVDANASYEWKDSEHRALLDKIDARNLRFIEQPLKPWDIASHVEICKQLNTPIGLDESLVSEDVANFMLDLGGARMMCVKPSVVGGCLAAKRLLRRGMQLGVPVTVGGMVETSLTRAVSLCLAAVPGAMGVPAEVSPDGRWFEESINAEPLEMVEGKIAVPNSPGLGVDVDIELVEQLTLRSQVIMRSKNA